MAKCSNMFITKNIGVSPHNFTCYILPSQEDFLFRVYKSIIMATCSTTTVPTCCSHKNNQDS